MTIILWIVDTTIVVFVLALLSLIAGGTVRLSPACRHAILVLAMIRLITPPVLHCPLLSVDRAFSRGSASPGAGGLLTWREVRPISAGGSQRIALPPLKLTAAPASRLWDGHFREAFRHAGTMLLGTWLLGSLLFLVVQVRGAFQFQRLVERGMAGPGRLVEQLERMAGELGVRAPALQMVPGLGTPLLWCLGRPVLCLPTFLVERLDAEQWEKVMAHELAHIRRGDHWVSRLSLIVGVFWWWHPLYWFVRWRIEIESELACDAWVVRSRPADRACYAKTIVDVCELVALPEAKKSLSLGIFSSDALLERRLKMIMNGRMACRMGRRELIAGAILTLLAIPTWTGAQSGSHSGAGSRPDQPPKEVKAAGPSRSQDARQDQTPPLVLPAAVGTVDLQRVMIEYERVKDSSDQFRQLAEEKKKELNALNDEVQKEAALLAKLVPGSDDYTRHENRKSELSARHELLRERRERDFSEMEAKTMALLYRDVQEETAAVARARGLTYVLKIPHTPSPEAGPSPSAMQATLAESVLYSDPRADITEEVIRRLNKRYAVKKGSADEERPDAPQRPRP